MTSPRPQQFAVLILALMAVSTPALAQVDFSGEWGVRMYEDQPERVPGPELGDFLGIPINDAARLRATAWDASIQTLREWQCRPHSADYIWRGPSQLKISKEVDPVSRDITAFHAEWLRSVDRPIYLDGRPHPSPNAPHTWGGFSTGRWEGDMLTVTVTHLKEGYLRRNGLPRSDKATVREHWIRNGDFLTVAVVVTDPVYLTEPFIRTTDYELALNQQVPPYPCGVVQEVDRPKDQVPHFLPGDNPYMTEFATRHKIPVEATRGGAETMYPEFRAKLGEAMTRAGVIVTAAALVVAAFDSGAAAQQPTQPAPPSPRLRAPVDLTGYWVSVVTEDWRWRMVTPPKGDYSSLPLTAAARKVADTWDPARDAAAGQACRAYGAAAIMRVPGRIRIAWENDTTLRVDTEAGTQTRLFRFIPGGGEGVAPSAAEGAGAGAAAAGPPAWQGRSVAQWQIAGGRRGAPPSGGSLRVVTSGMRPGYLRKNGVPYSANAVVTEYYNRTSEPNGDVWLIVTTIVEDPLYLAARFVTSSHFKKAADGSVWNPTPCEAS